jgi:1,4-dihydroxy-2-naphthoate octaprenyltransferase
MSSTAIWLKAFRLRTLPLALSSIALGSFLASASGQFSWLIFSLAAITTVFLQVLSNLANDYGDSVSGVDNVDRVGPKRSVQSGAISLKSMRNAIILFVGLSLFSGVWLIIEGTKGISVGYWVGFLLLGIAAIAAAIKYTVGKNPYGYQGFGDVFVFLFFGLTGVAGTFFLHTNVFVSDILLPAIAIGLLSAGVLNLNNMRDQENDKKSGKYTLVVKLGAEKARYYHFFLVGGAVVAALVFTLLNFHSAWQLLFLATLPLLLKNIITVAQNKEPRLLDPELKKLALTTLLFAILFGLGLNI